MKLNVFEKAKKKRALYVLQMDLITESFTNPPITREQARDLMREIGYTEEEIDRYDKEA